MADTAVMEPDDEEFYSADEVGTTPELPRTPLPPEVMEEIASITNKLVKFKEKKNPEIEDTLQLFINEWRHQTKQEIEDLKVLKKRVTIRKSQRAEEEVRMEEMRREEEEMLVHMAEEEKIRKQEEKIKRLRDAELKRQKMMEEQSKGRNFKLASTTNAKADGPDISREPTKEEYEAMKEAALSVIIKPMEIGGLRKERLKRRAQEMWDKVAQLETERYDLEERRARQEYDYKELKERQKQQLRAKALKLGLEPEALTGRYPPKIRVASKYERRKGLRPFGETKGLFEGGFIEDYNQKVNDEWMKRQEVFTKRNPEDLPPWLADMPRQIIKQIEEEEAAIRTVITKEEMEGKEAPNNEDAIDGDAEENGEDKIDQPDINEVEVDEMEDEEAVENQEIVIADDAVPSSEEPEEACSIAATEDVEEENEIEFESEKPGSPEQQHDVVGEMEEVSDVVSQEEEESDEEEQD
ncbi:unnamed protein product [Orchesella dallaii]|uniref:Troponin T n=1 Tax=Orchesella dallaii TaxID=48710 RepID=A0ABP1RQJ8_9HEXA